jgi:hypothetical protein
MKKIATSKIKLNPNNPRLIKDEKFKKLVQSIKDFPEMLDIRPIVVNADMIILGGNMRYKACVEAGLKEIPVIIADKLTEDQQREFLIKDNTSGGEWNWEMLANEWDAEDLKDWGLDVPTFESNTGDYFDTDEELNIEKEKISATSDEYSTFELIMLHENKIVLLETLNKIKSEFLFEKQEDALMELIRQYNK